MNENFIEVESVMIDMSIKRVAYAAGEYINDGRIKKIWLASLGDFMCIKMLIETKSGERTFARFIRLDSVESIEAMYV